MTTADQIIVALDVSTKEEALNLLEQLLHPISFFKVGLQLYTAEGPEIVRTISSTGAKVFLDLKLHDIPNTVARTVERVNALGAQALTIHLSGGSDMVRAASEARGAGMLLLGVTVLTSATEKTLREIGVAHGMDNQVLRLATLGVEYGINGLVASARELEMLRRQFGTRVKLVAPGIRPSWSLAGDQKRAMTPRQALEAGADYLVIGRPITSHPRPREAVDKILQELA
jgi:orotidine-5'-phosphate decarboxylase